MKCRFIVERLAFVKIVFLKIIGYIHYWLRVNFVNMGLRGLSID